MILPICRRFLYALVLVLSIAEFAFLYDAKSLEWWQNGIIYQIYPRSFKDSDGDGIGDLKGIAEKSNYLKELGIAAVWLSPIFESPMVDFGYDVSDFYKIAKIFGTLDDFRSLKKKLDSLDIKLILDFVPNHSSDECDWFRKSIEKIEPYTDYYIWKDPSGWNNTTPFPPNNWVSVFNGPAWEYNNRRKQFYLHQFTTQQPDLNYRNEHLLKEIEKILTYWLDEGLDGFRIDSVSYMIEHPNFPNESKNEEISPEIPMSYDSLIHLYSRDWHENYDLIKKFENIVDSYSLKDGKPRIVINEAYTSFENTMKFYDKESQRHMPFNFYLITDLKEHSTADDFVEVITRWLNGMPKDAWPNWVIGNHDNSRVASRFGTELIDGMNMINLLLPGTAITYNGEEIGMVDTFVRWDQTVDPWAKNTGEKHYRKVTRDPARTPFQWDSSRNAGFSTNPKPWLPVNPNYWKLNLQEQRNSTRSHFRIYQRLAELRYHPTIQYGKTKVFAISKWVLAFSRKLKNHDSVFIIVNLGSEEQIIQKNLPPVLTVHTSSLNSDYQIGDIISIFQVGVKMRPKSALVLTAGRVPSNEKSTYWISELKTFAESVLDRLLKIIIIS